MQYESVLTLGAADMNDMRRVVGVNEEIKGVVRAARELSLVAINTMLAARRAGADVRGFAVVSLELRSFSSKLQALMDALALDMADLIRDVASLTKETCQRRRLAAALALRGHPVMATALAQVDCVLTRMARTNAAAWRGVQRVIAQALRQCEVGRTLARGAKIEAVYGGRFSAQLNQAGVAIERSIELIRYRLFNAWSIARSEA